MIATRKHPLPPPVVVDAPVVRPRPVPEPLPPLTTVQPKPLPKHTPPNLNLSRRVTYEEIVRLVCAQLVIFPEELGGRARHPRVVWARRMVVDICREATIMSYPEIARSMPRPNHSSIIDMHQSVRQVLAFPVGNRYRTIGHHDGSVEDYAVVRNRVRYALNLPSAELPAPGIKEQTDED